MKKLISVIGKIIVLVFFIICIAIALPRVLGFQEYNVISGSMQPKFPVGTLCYAKGVDFSDISVSDVIVFKSIDSVITHRVVEVIDDEQAVITKGDANPVNDFRPVSYADILGRVEFYIPVLGYIAEYLSYIYGKLVALLLLAVGLFMASVSNKTKADKNNEINEDTSGNKSKKTNKAVYLIPVVGIALIFICAFGIFTVFNDYNGSNETYKSLAKNKVESTEFDKFNGMEIDFETLQAENPDCIGWVYIDEMDPDDGLYGVDYPIMYSGDDENYLHRDFYGNTFKAGSVFLEAANTPDFSDSHTILYGHNMRNKSMFGTLKNYKTNEDYLAEHPYFYIYTPNAIYQYMVFSYFDTDAGSWVYGVPYADCPEFADYIKELKRYAYGISGSSKKQANDADVSIEKMIADYEFSTADKIVTLSTCSTSGKRFVVNGVLVDSVIK